ncbi:hypothetical protein BUALT_Bualt12G0074300 [Buddleja alternifolia]|uniref:SRP54-type proteins GTP-binding domain-containing protein n=1 Tax=Buddleja alternifolia TaxID=168488 RepID=A0AAV6WPK5_9LAMI|nr:hypothetical protein BUALT_Bualt12G0074300 [Buddleja alternifolia]
MVLVQLGRSISRALQHMSNATIVDEKMLNDCLNDIARALLQANVHFKLVRDMQTNIKKIVNFDDLAAGHNKRKIIQQVNNGTNFIFCSIVGFANLGYFNKLCKILDPGKPAFTLKKGETSVVMFVGLQDTFRAGAFDQFSKCCQGDASSLTTPSRIEETNTCPYQELVYVPLVAGYYFGLSGHYCNDMRIAVEGVERFKKENCDLIIVDTSGRHKQEAALFEEMRQYWSSCFQSNSSIQAAVGAVIVTKMDGDAKGGGALNAVAAMKNPVIFMGTGEHINEFEVLDVKPFVSRLLGMGDLSGFTDKIHENVPMDQQAVLLQELLEGTFTLRNFLKMGPIVQAISILPGASQELMRRGHEKEVQANSKRLEISKKRDMNAQKMRHVRPPDMLRQFGGMGGLQNLMKQMCGGALRI